MQEIVLSRKQRILADLCHRVDAGKLPRAQAAEQAGVSLRPLDRELRRRIDGNSFEWVPGRAPFCCWVFIDDASSAILALRFEPAECALGYARGREDLIGEHGLPQALYSDRHSIFAHTPEARGEPSGKSTRFKAMLDGLGVGLVLARYPQAKGRVERCNKTLQDRMAKAMRRDGVMTIEAANAWAPSYVARHNARFQKETADPEPAFEPYGGAPRCGRPWRCGSPGGCQKTCRSPRTGPTAQSSRKTPGGSPEPKSSASR